MRCLQYQKGELVYNTSFKVQETDVIIILNGKISSMKCKDGLDDSFNSKNQKLF